MARQQSNQLPDLLFAAEKQVGVLFLKGAKAGICVPAHAGLRFTNSMKVPSGSGSAVVSRRRLSSMLNSGAGRNLKSDAILSAVPLSGGGTGHAAFTPR